MDFNYCPNCGKEMTGRFCAHCGLDTQKKEKPGREKKPKEPKPPKAPKQKRARSGKALKIFKRIVWNTFLFSVPLIMMCAGALTVVSTVRFVEKNEQMDLVFESSALREVDLNMQKEVVRIMLGEPHSTSSSGKTWYWRDTAYRLADKPSSTDTKEEKSEKLKRLEGKTYRQIMIVFDDAGLVRQIRVDQNHLFDSKKNASTTKKDLYEVSIDAAIYVDEELDENSKIDILEGTSITATVYYGDESFAKYKVFDRAPSIKNDTVTLSWEDDWGSITTSFTAEKRVSTCYARTAGTDPLDRSELFYEAWNCLYEYDGKSKSARVDVIYAGVALEFFGGADGKGNATEIGDYTVRVVGAQRSKTVHIRIVEKITEEEYQRFLDDFYTLPTA